MFCDEGSNSRVQEFGTLDSMIPSHSLPPIKTKKKRNLPGNPDPEAEVIALSPKTLMATNRFVCEICNRGFQRDQNLQLHRRGHNLPWKLKQRSSKDNRKRAYVCPEPTCLHHHPSRALGDLTGIKKHYCRKHGEKKWKCEKCEKIYAVQSDWKAHSKTCGTREYRCDCGTLFSRKDSFITHRAFCDALAEESARLSAATNSLLPTNPNPGAPENLPALLPFSTAHFRNPWTPHMSQNPNPTGENMKHETLHNIPISSSSPLYQGGALMTPPFGNLHVNTTLPPLSATALLQKAATMGTVEGHVGSTMVGHLDMHTWQKNSRDGMTRDFLGLTGSEGSSNGGGMMMSFTGGVKFPAAYDRDRNSVFKHHGFGFTETCSGWSNC